MGSCINIKLVSVPFCNYFERRIYFINQDVGSKCSSIGRSTKSKLPCQARISLRNLHFWPTKGKNFFGRKMLSCPLSYVCRNCWPNVGSIPSQRIQRRSKRGVKLCDHGDDITTMFYQSF